MFTVKQHMGKVSRVSKDRRSFNLLMDCCSKRGCQRDEHPRTLSAYNHALLWADALPGQFRAPLQLHRGLDRLDALASRSNGLTERSPEPLIGFDQLRVLIRRGNRRLSYQLVSLPGAEVVMSAHRLKCSHPFSAVHFVRTWLGVIDSSVFGWATARR